MSGRWHTWIDYPKFQELWRRYLATGESFTATDYMAETAGWSVYGAAERGFDPEETRWHRRKKNKDIGGC